MNRPIGRTVPLTRSRGDSTCALFGDHPGWKIEDGTARRVLRKKSATRWLIEDLGNGDLSMLRLSGDDDPPIQDVFDPRTLPVTNELTEALAARGPFFRVRNPDLWDALATGLIRQVIRAGQAKKLYRLLCAEHGERVDTVNGPLFFFPAPEVLRNLPDSEYSRLGLSFKRDALRIAAEAMLNHQEEWTGLSPDELSTALLSIPRVGPWTAAAVITDITNDFSHYAHGDLAVRTWARRLAPGMPWPDSEQAFARHWQHIAAGHLSCLTALTLALGGTS
ncbi:DNA-3-methyladenine glycosylase family protein [Amycolatopsis sp. NPDC005003]